MLRTNSFKPRLQTHEDEQTKDEENAHPFDVPKINIISPKSEHSFGKGFNTYGQVIDLINKEEEAE
jgi:hypothetical protein